MHFHYFMHSHNALELNAFSYTHPQHWPMVWFKIQVCVVLVDGILETYHSLKQRSYFKDLV